MPKPDSQDLGHMSREEKRKYYSFITANGSDCACGCEDRIEEVRKESYQAGFQEAVEEIKKEVKKIHIWKNCSDDFNAELSPMIRVSEVKDIFKSLKLTPDQGSEGEGK